MAIVTPPGPFPLASIRVDIREPFQQNRSAWTGRRWGVGLPGAATWLFKAQFGAIADEAKARPWRGFLVALRGQANKFRLPVVRVPQTIAGNPTVRSGADAGFTLPLQGLPANQTVLDAGHAITVPLPGGRERLVYLTAPLVSNGSGQGTAAFGPDLGEAPATGAEVEIGLPWSLVTLATDTNGWDISNRIRHGFAFEAEEAG